MSTRLVLIRHAHTAANDEGDQGRLCGWADLPLTRVGRVQVNLLRQRLRGTAPFATIYSSPLARARDTARALSKAGLGPLRLRRDLREIGCGTVDGMTIGEVRRRFPSLWEANTRQNDEDFRWPGGESYREFRRRCLSAVSAIAAAHPATSVAIVTHAGFITQVVGAIRGDSPACWGLSRTGNTALTELVWSNGSAALIRLDDRDHLARPAELTLAASA